MESLPEDLLSQRWDLKRASAWHDSLGWLVGCNFIPSHAINQLEMWQAETFNPQEIDRELGWLAALGMNSMRVFLHDLPWEQDAEGFLTRIDQFLNIAHRHGIGIMFVFFDSVWHPFPHPGPQREPEPGVHNSFWVQSPGVKTLQDGKAFLRLEDYVRGVIGRFGSDPRVQVWDLWNEPDNSNANSYGPRDFNPEKKAQLVLPLLARVFQWARSAGPSQPLTSGVWQGAWTGEKVAPLTKFQLEASDVISFHMYGPLPLTRVSVENLKPLGRPLLCTEYMARGVGSTFEAILPYFKKEGIAAYNWGAVAGKSQTIYPWDSWQNPYPPEPPLWFHDIFRRDGSAYDPKEVDLIKSLTGRSRE
ncbi:MAG: cellulase family glycosylhydrolase [Methylacidiphilales bacterium]|nr:cellulase family glycosylhydrolase [Candidatus Methylacidiphilales bacterium]